MPWDPVHSLDCCIGDIRTKEEDGVILRVNKFHSMYGLGRGHMEYIGHSEQNDLTRSSVANFEQLDGIYWSF